MIDPTRRWATLKYGKGTSAVAKHRQGRASAPSVRDRIRARENLARYARNWISDFGFRD